MQFYMQWFLKTLTGFLSISIATSIHLWRILACAYSVSYPFAGLWSWIGIRVDVYSSIEYYHCSLEEMSLDKLLLLQIIENSEWVNSSGVERTIFPCRSYQPSTFTFCFIGIAATWAFVILTQVCVLLFIHSFFHGLDITNLGLYAEYRQPAFPLDRPSFTGIGWTFFIWSSGLT